MPFPVVDGQVEAILVGGDTAFLGGRFDSIGPPTGLLGVIDASDGPCCAATRTLRTAGGKRLSRIAHITLRPGQTRTIRLHPRPAGRRLAALRLRPAVRPFGTRRWTSGPAVHLR